MNVYAYNSYSLFLSFLQSPTVIGLAVAATVTFLWAVISSGIVVLCVLFYKAKKRLLTNQSDIMLVCYMLKLLMRVPVLIMSTVFSCKL